MSAKACSSSSTVEPSAPQFLETLVTGGLLALALGITATMPAHSSEVPISNAPIHPVQPQSSNVPLVATAPRSLPNGIYLYGQSAKPNQVGSAYLVIKVSDHQVVGAFYMPSSSFDCFQGKVQGDQLALTVVNSEEQTRYPYSVALRTSGTVATSGNPGLATVNLVGYHRIQTLSDNDHKILKTCQASR